MVTEAVWNHLSTLLPHVNSKGFFTFDAVAYSVYIQHHHLTLLHQYLRSMKGGAQWEGVGVYFFGCLVLVCVCVCL